MATEFTPDARQRLTDLLSEAADAAQANEEHEVREDVTAIRELLAVEADDTPLRSRLFHGCEAVERTVADDAGVAEEYLRSMEACVQDETES